MRAVSQAWGSLNASRQRRRRFVIEVELPSGSVYIASHSNIDTPSAPLAARLKEPPEIASQKLNPDEGRATIGSMSFSAVDINGSLTERQRDDLLSNSEGWRLRRVRHWSGFAELSFSSYELEDTQLLDGATYRSGVWSFKCRDIQRELRKKIAEPVVMHLAQPLSATSTTVEVFTTTGLEAVEHGASYSDAPSQTVAYVKIDDEIIRVPSGGIGATQLTGVTRGVLGTRAAEHTTDESKGSERGKKVTEVIYLELPVPKLVYAVATGILIGQVGTLPDHWHLGISSDFIRLGDFQNIGPDLYVQADDTLGSKERYILTKGEDGKRFIEKEILSKYGLFMPVHNDGQLGLRRGQPVLSGSAVVGEITDSHILEPVTLDYDMQAVINDIEIAWNEIKGEPSRTLQIIDQNSVTAWGDAPQYRVVARGLVGSIHTDSRVRDIYEGLRDRYSGPPIRTSISVHSSQSLYEVGDVVRIRTPRVRDFTNEATETLDRPFEVQGVTKRLGSGEVRYDLFASTQRAGPLPPLESQNALPDAWYTSEGTDIAGLAGVVDTGSELQLPNGLQLTGASTLGGAVYYATKDVRVPAGNTVNYTQNVQLRIRGVLQVDGEMNGAGTGLAGVTDTVNTSGIPDYGSPAGPVSFATQAGTPGYFGTTQADGGIIERVRRRSGSSSKYRVRIQSLPATVTQGRVEAIPSLNVNYNGSLIRGVPADLRGTSGGPGGLRYWNESRDNNIDINRGGAGGAGGAGLLIVGRGMVFGASGRIVSSGGNGSPGVRNAADERPAWSGSGAGGAPGATIILLDGSSAPSPVLTSGTIIADNGATPPVGEPSEQLADSWIDLETTRFGPPTVDDALVPNDRVSTFTSGTSARKAGIAAARFFFLLPPVTAEEDTDDVDLAGNQDIALGLTEAFAERVDPKITTLLATVTENSTTAAYSHANIYVKGSSAGAQYQAAWTFFGPAEPSLRFELPADGETYVVRAVPVLINGVEAATGIEQTKIVSSPGLGFPVGSLSLKINVEADGSTPQAGEAVLAGLKGDGTPDYTKDGATLWDGALVAVPRLFGGTEAWTLATNVANKKGFICFDTALTSPFTVNAVAGNVAFVYKQGGTWYYDNNSVGVSFTPTSAMVALGWLETGAADSITGGALFVSPVQLTLTPEPAATKNQVSSGTATPTGGDPGDLYYETDAQQWWSNIGGTWTKVSDTTAARALDIIHTGPTAPVSPGAGWLWADTSVSPNVLKRYNGSSWVTVATLNTGDLADKDTVGQLDIDTYAVARVSVVERTTNAPFNSAVASPGTWVTLETVDLDMPANVANSAVLVEMSARCDLEVDDTQQRRNVVFFRVLDDDNVVVGPTSKRTVVHSIDINLSNYFGSGSFSVIYVCPPSQLNASETNTFKLQALVPGLPVVDAKLVEMTLRASLLNRAF